MKWAPLIRRSFRSLMLHRLRSLLSTLGILFGVVAVVAMLSIGEGAKQETLEQIELLGMNTMIIKQSALSEAQQSQASAKRSFGLTLKDAEVLSTSIPNVILYAPMRVVKAPLPGALQNTAPEILAVSRSYNDLKGLLLAEGRFICDLDQKEKRLVSVIGSEVAKALGQKGHKGKDLRIGNLLFQIVGILAPSERQDSKNAILTARNVNQSIFIPLGSDESFQNIFSKSLSEIVLQIKSSQDLVKTSLVVQHVLERRHGDYQDYQIIIPQELLNQAQQAQRTFNLVLGSIAAISLIVGGIGIMNMMLANVSERIREIGIRRALGATRKDIMLQFLSETLLLTSCGAFLGIVLGVFCAFSISYLAEWKTIVTFWSLSLSLFMAVGVGLCSGLYPAYQAACLDPITALRRE